MKLLTFWPSFYYSLFHSFRLDNYPLELDIHEDILPTIIMSHSVHFNWYCTIILDRYHDPYAFDVCHLSDLIHLQHYNYCSLTVSEILRLNSSLLILIIHNLPLLLRFHLHCLFLLTLATSFQNFLGNSGAGWSWCERDFLAKFLQFLPLIARINS